MFSLTLSAPSSRLLWLALLLITILITANQATLKEWSKAQIEADYAHFEDYHFADSYKLVNFAMDQFDLCDTTVNNFKRKRFPAKLEITIQILAKCALVPMDLQTQLLLAPEVKNQKSFQREFSIPKFKDRKVEREYREYYSEHYSKDCEQVARMEHFTVKDVNKSQLEMNRIGYGVVFRKFWRVYVFSNAQTYVSQHFSPFYHATIYPHNQFLPTLVAILSSQLSSYTVDQLQSFLSILDLPYGSILLQKAISQHHQTIPPFTLNHLVPIPPKLDPFLNVQLSGEQFTSIGTVQGHIKLEKIFSLIVKKFVHFKYNSEFKYNSADNHPYPALFRAQLAVEVKAYLLVGKQVFLHKKEFIDQGQQDPPRGQGPQDSPRDQGPQDPPSGQGSKYPPSGPQDLPPSGLDDDYYPLSFQVPPLKLKYPHKPLLYSGLTGFLAGFIAGKFYFNQDVVHPEDVIIPSTHDQKMAPSSGGSGMSQTEWIWALGLFVVSVILLIALAIGFSILRSRRSH